ncbi:hypothetical protein L3556_06705 [Candidatus Synechococcus calcipolaris G9]|uniref:Uncharacterized protein n=1 Tax=Candidatus Synechococcus calcipolaris G9 TaxID=1497997 RepID=A0ABT6EXU6_9SYNE|nr:hypothetical protein [Candidatus Synechococcus calcipolaris]MDG2990625.1 hypothetical protein [Candidatus Synechococcus calcipolaris G9]
MARFTPFSLQMQISQMFQQGQSFFAVNKVQDWLRERQQNPGDYEISFEQQPAPPGSGLVYAITIQLRRKDGQPVDSWLLEQLASQE